MEVSKFTGAKIKENNKKVKEEWLIKIYECNHLGLSVILDDLCEMSEMTGTDVFEKYIKDNKCLINEKDYIIRCKKVYVNINLARNLIFVIFKDNKLRYQEYKDYLDLQEKYHNFKNEIKRNIERNKEILIRNLINFKSDFSKILDEEEIENINTTIAIIKNCDFVYSLMFNKYKEEMKIELGIAELVHKPQSMLAHVLK